MHNS